MFITINFYLLWVTTLIILLYLYLTRHFNYWKNQNVPYIKPIPFFGSALRVIALKRCIGEFVADIYKTTKAPFIGFFVFDQPFLLLRDLDLIKRVLIKDFEYFDDRSVIENRRDDELGSNILFLLKNPHWRPLRMKLTPVFATGKMKNMLPLMVDCGHELVDYMNRVVVNESSTESREVCMKYTTDVIASCAFGINAHCFKFENAAFRVISRRIFHWNFSRGVQMSSYFFAPVLVKLFKMKFLDPPSARFMRKAFLETLEEREISGVQRGDLIDILIQIRKQNVDNDFALDDEKLVAQAAQFFIAGYETTGTTISFTLYELALNPKIQDRLRIEIKSVLKKHGQLSYEAIQDMNYLDMTVNETLRKYPVLPYLDRRCTKTYKIPGTEVIIRKGIPVYIPLFGLHFDPQYFPDPEKYDPERFSYEKRQLRPSYTYMPFGEGLHNCIGKRFGLLSSKVAVIRIIADFEVELCEETPIPMTFDPKGFLIAPPDGLKLRFKRHID